MVMYNNVLKKSTKKNQADLTFFSFKDAFNFSLSLLQHLLILLLKRFKSHLLLCMLFSFILSFIGLIFAFYFKYTAIFHINF